LSSTPSLELDEEYEARHDDENMDHIACMRQWEEDLTCQNHLETKERHLNHSARHFDIHEAPLHRQEHRCDQHEADLHAARLRGRARAKGSQ
jgi:hypothetical protein